MKNKNGSQCVGVLSYAWLILAGSVAVGFDYSTGVHCTAHIYTASIQLRHADNHLCATLDEAHAARGRPYVSPSLAIVEPRMFDQLVKGQTGRARVKSKKELGARRDQPRRPAAISGENLYLYPRKNKKIKQTQKFKRNVHAVN